MGDLHTAQGNVAAAGQVYELAAGAGLAQAAATYDAGELGAPQRALHRAECQGGAALV